MNITALVIGGTYSYRGMRIFFSGSHEEDEDFGGFPLYDFDTENGQTLQLTSDMVEREVKPVKHVKPEVKPERRWLWFWRRA